MPIDPVTRTVELGQATHTVAISQEFAIDPAGLWRLVTEPDALATWFDEVRLTRGDGVATTYELPGSATAGTVLECEEGRRLALTWEHDGDVSTLALLFSALGDGTRLTLMHAVNANEHWDTYGPSAVGIGWDESLRSLARATSTRGGIEDADDAAFVARTAGAWRQAHENAGATPEEAAAQAKRTAEFYGA